MKKDPDAAVRATDCHCANCVNKMIKSKRERKKVPHMMNIHISSRGRSSFESIQVTIWDQQKGLPTNRFQSSAFKLIYWSDATISICCFLQVEKLARTLFLWKIEVHEQKEKVYEMRRWNEALVTNMLPEHVARHFLGSKKRDEV